MTAFVKSLIVGVLVLLPARWCPYASRAISSLWPGFRRG
jgi:hypothetical protein